MSYLLDTNVVSELRKRPGVVDPNVAAWFVEVPVGGLYISVVTVLEIELGVARVEHRDPRQGVMLRAWLEERVLGAFAGRILSIGVEVARRAAMMHVPNPRPERDAYVAATAVVHGMTVVTRNVADFAAQGVPLVNPWTPSRTVVQGPGDAFD